MYVDASDLCNDLVFQLGGTPMGTANVARQWNIKVNILHSGQKVVKIKFLDHCALIQSP